MNSTYRKLTYTITTLLISSIAMYFYTASLVSGAGYYNKYDLGDGLFDSAIELLIYLGLSTFFLQQIIKKNWRILLSTFLYLVVLQELFFNIAYSLCYLFGATWNNTGIRFGLVLYYKKTSVLLSVSAIIYYLLLRFLRSKNTLDETSTNHKKK